MEMKDKIKGFLLSELINSPGMSLGDEDDLLLSGLVDSLGVVRLITYIEEDLGIKVPPEDVTIENFLTVQAITNYLTRRKEAVHE